MTNNLTQVLIAKAVDSGLSKQQITAVTDVAAGNSVFVTGCAGTGKTHLLNFLRGHLSLSLTASTGIAALHIRGQTIHSWAGLGTGKKSAPQIIEDLEMKAQRYKDQTIRRVSRASRLVIDEVSMLSAEILDLLDAVLRRIRGYPEKPFGGIQMIFVGDICQLPPVTKGRKEPSFCFEAASWLEADVKVHLLTQVYRQEDEKFARLLGKIRVGDLDDEVQDFLRARYEAVDDEPDTEPCVLETTNAACRRVNQSKLDALEGAPRVFEASESCKHQAFLDQLDKSCLAPRNLTLKVGARVLLLRNIDVGAGLVNGAMGKVASLTPLAVQFDSGYQWVAEYAEWENLRGDTVLASRRQYPLTLAWAITAHRSQGMTLEKVLANLSNCFAQGQAYVALSRVKTPEGLFLTGKGIRVEANDKAVKFYEENHLDPILGQ